MSWCGRRLETTGSSRPIFGTMASSHVSRATVGPPSLRFHSTFDSCKLSEATDRRSLFGKHAPRVSHLNQGSLVGIVGDASRQSKAVSGVLPILVAGAQGCPPVLDRRESSARMRRKG